MAMLTHKKNGKFIHEVNDLKLKYMIEFAEIASGFKISFQCHNVTIMKNSQGDRVIIQEVKLCHRNKKSYQL